jgi:hypothetical protein
MNKTLKLFFAITFAMSFLLLSCDIVTPPYEENEKPPVDTTKYKRNVLLEEYTGARCGNCPRAAELAAALHEHYGDRLILMTVHAGGYAKPGGTKYTYDFRTPEGNEYDSFFGNSKAGNPNGMISIIGYPNEHIKNEGAWDGAIQEVIAKKPVMTIDLEASIDTNKMEISIDYKIKYLENGSPNDNLVILIVEDSIIKYQTDYRKHPSDIPDYVHMHILRGSVNGAWGQPLNAQGINKGDEFEDNVKYTIPAEKDWVPKNLSIIAFVHDKGDTYEVLQVQKAHLELK